MSTADQEFLQSLRAMFRVEAQEHLQLISARLLEMEKSPGERPNPQVIEQAYREAHSLKGAARSVDAAEIEAICQSIEGIFGAWKRDLLIPDAKSLNSIHDSLNHITALVGDGKPSASPPPPDAPAPPPAPATDHSSIPTVRIATEKLDTQLMKVEEMITVKGVFTDRARDMRDLSGRFETWRGKWGRISAGTRALRQSMEQKNEGESSSVSTAIVDFLEWNADCVRSMEEKILTLSAKAQRDHHVVSRHVDELLEESKKLLMLPVSTIAGVFPKLVRDLCRDQQKEADLTMTGTEIELDRRILEEIKDALIHVLRNCVDHGIETPARRSDAKKSPRASVQIAVAPTSSGKVEIRISDDGAGIDLDRVKASAIRLGIITEEDAKKIGDRDAMALVFHSEVSTTESVTEISGRGLGMAIVREKTEKLGGRVSIESVPGAGTTLRILLPVTLATFRGLIVSAGDYLYAVPTRHVQRVFRIKASDIQTVENRETIRVSGSVVSVSRLETVLGEAPSAKPPDADGKLTLMLLTSGEQRIALVVDEILREEEILVKPLPCPVARTKNIAGITLQDSGKPMAVLGVADLMTSVQTAGGSTTFHPPQPKAVPAAKRILVVEDSITSRMLIKGILESAGFKVQTAVDGIDGFTRLREQPFDCVVSDVEMPRLDGFGLAARIRQDPKFTDLPVVLVTALESRTERERGIDSGASAYIVKSSFDQSNLLEAVRRLV